MSWRPEVIADNSGNWVPNGQRFATEAEALFSASDLAGKWILVRDWRAVESTDPVNYAVTNGYVVPVVKENDNG